MGSNALVRWKTSALCLATAVAVLAVLAPAVASATHLTATGTGGATAPWGFNEDWGYSGGVFSGADTADSHMQLAGAIMPDSLSANRFHVQWAFVEEDPGTYDWTISDAVYAAMQSRTANPIMLLHRAPEWARDPAATCPFGPEEVCAYPPDAAHDDEWKAFVQAAVARYPNVRAIEIWNEPNLGIFWAPAPDPNRYAAVLGAAHDGVLAAGSGAPVLVGGLFPVATSSANINASEFLDQVYVAAGAGAFEGIGSHPYTRQAPYVERMWSRLDALRAVRDSHGDGATPLWVTEMGISTEAADGVPLDQQGDAIVQLYRSIEGHDVRSFVIHRLYDIGSDYPGQFGVLHEDLTPKPAYGELGAAIGTASPLSSSSLSPSATAAVKKQFCRGEAATVAGTRAKIAGTDGADVINGTSGDDVIVGLGGKDLIRGRGGDDLICGGNGKDRLIGGPGDDKLLGQGGADTLKGGAGRDTQTQ